MIQGVLLASIEKISAGLIAAERVIFVGIPERAHDREVLFGSSIAQRVRKVLLAPVVAGCPFQAGGDDVPTGPTAADQVQRGERPRHVEGLVVRGGERGHEPDARSHSGHRGEQRQGLQAVQEVWRRIGRDVGAVDDEDEVEFGCFPRAALRPCTNRCRCWRWSARPAVSSRLASCPRLEGSPQSQLLVRHRRSVPDRSRNIGSKLRQLATARVASRLATNSRTSGSRSRP